MLSILSQIYMMKKMWLSEKLHSLLRDYVIASLPGDKKPSLENKITQLFISRKLRGKFIGPKRKCILGLRKHMLQVL